MKKQKSEESYYYFAVFSPSNVIGYEVRENRNIKGRGWYPQRVSFNAFWRKYHFDSPAPIEIFTGEDWMIERLQKWNDGEVEVRYCDSLWEFYDHIGFDHKKKKFIKNTMM